MLQAIFKSDFISETSTLSRDPSSSITLIIFAAPGVNGSSELIDGVKFTGFMDAPSTGEKRNAPQAGAVLPACNNIKSLFDREFRLYSIDSIQPRCANTQASLDRRKNQVGNLSCE